MTKARRIWTLVKTSVTHSLQRQHTEIKIPRIHDPSQSSGKSHLSPDLKDKCVSPPQPWTGLRAELWSSCMRRVTLHYERLLLMMGIKRVCSPHAGSSSSPLTFLNFPSEYPKADGSGGGRCVCVTALLGWTMGVALGTPVRVWSSAPGAGMSSPRDKVPAWACCWGEGEGGRKGYRKGCGGVGRLWRGDERTTSKAPLSCTILSRVQPESCKNWLHAHIWRCFNGFISKSSAPSMRVGQR